MATAEYRWSTGTFNKDEIETLGRYGIDHHEYGRQVDDDENSHLKGDYDDLRKELAKRASSDYDTRRPFEASALAGDKQSRKYATEGFEDAIDVVDAYAHMKTLGKKYGSGEDLLEQKNRSALTHGLVEHDRNTQNDRFKVEAKERSQSWQKSKEQKAADQSSFLDEYKLELG